MTASLRHGKDLPTANRKQSGKVALFGPAPFSSAASGRLAVVQAAYGRRQDVLAGRLLPDLS
jgi:hypothetical protein